ncbi:putative cystathionine beta-lyase [Gracilariopsis chorda]|uniref:Putative cystathionine beta-lyase n=1 Tax=Gracilariopsis chorda TaxID=448386 RepID=A0A2V3IP73_9FLOR|nr:putative cystathionine beta-lyase [Gracilariopsis chorda]|eukprot:PXF43886.1 putative cystathionine beta-lyase [Gracilariopsis chorda]
MSQQAPSSVDSAPDPSSHSTLRTSGKNLELSHVNVDTRIVHGGVHKDEWTTDPLKRSVVNPPVYHASTVTFPNVKALRFASSDWPFTGMWYGRHGNPTTFALEEAFSAIEGADNACLTSSGVAAVNAALLAFVQSGDHVLITDAVYDPTRSFCDVFLKRFGVGTTYFSPVASCDEVRELIRPNTKLILVESPASLSFEVMDVPTIAQVAHEHNLKVLIDNTWGPTLLSPFENGCDVSINAATKYIGGHSDLMMGIVAAKDRETYRAIKNSVVQLGCPPGSDDAYLALRGLRTLGVRLRQHEQSALRIAKWLENRLEVKRVMHPGLPSHPQHELFKRQFKGSSGLFGFQLIEGFSQDALDSMLDGMKLHAMGFSWGGFESLLMQNNINSYRTVQKWKYGDGYGQTMRIHVGLEDVDDLIKDLDEGFDRLNRLNKT